VASRVRAEQEEGAPSGAHGQHRDPFDRPARGVLGQEKRWGARAKTLWRGMRDVAVFVQGLRYGREIGEMG
jgi:hypothetical protein